MPAEHHPHVAAFTNGTSTASKYEIALPCLPLTRIYDYNLLSIVPFFHQCSQLCPVPEQKIKYICVLLHEVNAQKQL
jgi:hypothetical protein